MELKTYQKKVIADLTRYLELLNETKSDAAAFRLFWQEKSAPTLGLYQNVIPGVPNLCFKVPTGGGKTFIACNAVRPIFDAPPRYPAFILCLPDVKARVLAIRSCKSNEPKGFKFSKPRDEQKRKVNSTQAVLSSKKAPKHDKKEAQHRAVWRDAGLRVQFHSSARRKARIFRCLIPFRLMSNSSRETTYFGKLSRMLSYAPNSRLTVSSEASR